MPVEMKSKRRNSETGKNEPVTKVPKLLDNAANEGIDDSDNESIPEKKEEVIKYAKDFKMSHFRRKLKGNDFIPELRHFLHLLPKKPKLITKYIAKKGKPLELAEAMGRIDKSHLYHISYLCEALHLVLMEILQNEKNHMESAVSAARYFLKIHGSVVEKLLESPNTSHRKCGLKLLTSIVCLEPELGRQLLISFNSISNTKTMEKMMSHSKTELYQSDTVRKCFIHFVLSYLIEGNIQLIRNILDKYELMLSLVSGLVFDDNVTVCVVLNTIKKYVLESLDITKTKKVYIFDGNTVKHLINLYDWKGPRYFAAMISKKIEDPSDYIDMEQKETVSKSIHEFLVVLLTSRKYGVVFDAMSNYRERQNIIPNKALAALEKPWTDAYKKELAINICKTCPELARAQIKKYGSFLRNKQSEHWTNIAEFIENIISSLPPTVMKTALEKITLTDFTYWVKDICLCPDILICLQGGSSLKSSSYSYRIATVKLLLCMFKQYCNYMNSIIEREKFKGNDLRKFKFDMINHVFVNFPTVENILLSLYASIEQQNAKGVDVLEHLELTLDIVLIIHSTIKSFVDKTGPILNYIQLLRPLYESDKGSEKNVNIELKAIKLILALVPTALNRNGELFSNVVDSLLNIFIYGTGESHIEACRSLKGILLNTGLFENDILQIDLWLHAFKLIDSNDFVSAKGVFLNHLRKAKSNSTTENIDENFLPYNGGHRDKDDIETLFKNIENDVTVEGFVEIPTLSHLLTIILRENESALKENVKNYLDTLIFLLFHYIPQNENVQKLYIKHYSTYNKYMISWIEKCKPGKMPKVNIPFFSEIYNSVLNGDCNFLDLFKSSNKMESGYPFVINGKDYNLDEILSSDSFVIMFIYQVIFIINQLSCNSNFESTYSKSCTHYLTHLLQILYNLMKKESKFSVTLFETKQEESSLNYLEHALKYIYCNHIYILDRFNIFAVKNSDHNLTNLLTDTTDSINQLNLKTFKEYTIHYRKKIVNQIHSLALGNIDGNRIENIGSIVKILEVFEMTDEDCVKIINSIININIENFISNGNSQSLYIELLIYALIRLSNLKTLSLTEECVIQLSNIYIKAIETEQIDITFEKFEDSLTNFLLFSHQCISYIGKHVFCKIFENKKISKNSIKFANLLLERRNDLNLAFLELLPSNVTRKEIIYPLLSTIIKKGVVIENKILNEIYQECKSGLIKTIEKPNKAGVIYKENVQSSIYLINQCMPSRECLDFTKKSFKIIDSVEIFQLKLIEAIFIKALDHIPDDDDSNQKSTIFVNFINILIQLHLVVFKRDNFDYIKIASITYYGFKWIKNYSSILESCNFENIRNSPNWNTFCKSCVKQGMRSDENADNVTKSLDEKTNAILLKSLSLFSMLIYENEGNNDIDELFEMAITHSNFMNIVLDQNVSMIKTELMHLIFVLVQKNKTIIKEKHVPIYLGAYQAKLSDCDRYILAILQFYEQNGISLHAYRPFVWGETAISHYSIKETEEKINLNQEPLVVQVMSLIDREICTFTVNNFPIWRNLNVIKQVPVLHFDDPLAGPIFGNNDIEKNIEAFTIENIDSETLNICPKKYGTYDDCYDPAFMIPLMCLSFAPEVQSQTVRPVQNGLLAIVFAALSSKDKQMRMAAGNALIRYRQHFENSKFLDKPVWAQAFDNIQNGLEIFRQEKSKSKTSVPRISTISALFLAKTTNILLDPTNPLYRVLTSYLLVKESMNFMSVPEFNVLFHNPDINHQICRKFIIEIIRIGIKCSSDTVLLVRTNTFKSIMGFYNSNMSTLEINLLILSIISSSVKIPASIKLLVEQVGIIPWLSIVINDIEYFHFDTIEGVITIISNMWYSIKIKQTELYNYKLIETRIFNLLIKLAEHISGRISLTTFSKYLNILRKTASPDKYKCLSAANLDKLINCCNRHFQEYIWIIENIKMYGILCLDSEAVFCERLRNLDVDPIVIFSLLSLREFVIGWCK